MCMPQIILTELKNNYRMRDEYKASSMMHFRMMLELMVTAPSEPQLWLFSGSLCSSPRELCKPLCSSLQSRIAMLSCCMSWHPMGYWQRKGAEGSGELCASMNHSYQASSQLQELLLWERKAPFSHVRLNKVFSVCQRNSVSSLNRTLQRNIKTMGMWDVTWEKKNTFLSSVALILDTFFIWIN